MNHHPQLPDRGLLRLGAASAVLGVVAALVQSFIDPSYSDDPGKAIEQASLSHVLTLSRVLDMAAFLLLLVGVSVITTVIPSARGGAWGRLARTFYTVSAAAGAMATMVVGSFPDIARSWADATPAQKPGYVAVYDSLDHVSGGIFAVSWATLGVFGVVYAVAIWRSGLFSRTLAGISVASGVALGGAIVVGVGFQIGAAFLLLILGLLRSYVVIVASGLKVWRMAGVPEVAPLPGPVPSGPVR
jgi:hypothetical protein